MRNPQDLAHKFLLDERLCTPRGNRFEMIRFDPPRGRGYLKYHSHKPMCERCVSSAQELWRARGIKV